LAFAAEHGAENTYLEVEEENAPARALYTSLGFTTAHRYHSRRLSRQDGAG
jgi:N-acetylglutamate synthase